MKTIFYFIAHDFLKLILIAAVAALVFSFVSCSGSKKMVKVHYNGCNVTRGYIGY